MGLMNKLRAELIDIIEWIDDSRNSLVWRFPRYHNHIKYGAQLIVRPGQQAIFVTEGKIADVFGPGQYELVTKNLPLLSTISGWKYGFDSPFKSEVYFVSTRQITDLKWGTPNPVMMRDPDFGNIRVRAFGTYTLKAKDPKILLCELVGTDGYFETEEISELLRSIVNTSFADVVAKSEIPVLDFASHYKELGEQIRKLVMERVDDEYGLEIPQLYIVNISVPAEVEQALDARTSMNAIGDMASYQGYQLGQAMPVAAANPAGGLAGAGVGLGMGLGIAQTMAPPAQGGGSPPAQSPPPPPPVQHWHLAVNGQTQGPFTAQQISDGIATGQVRADTLVWTAGMANWTAANQIPMFAAAFQPAPPPPPVAPTHDE
ncbi:MAG: SPFH domain-containing protein [Deltaproteobacteria bacterium]|jgi:membrane protease subunit (stomatin/prohibitin family)|nr:SPFH domain-containing protein [Deltaproteobacteria bacterium]